MLVGQRCEEQPAGVTVPGELRAFGCEDRGGRGVVEAGGGLARVGGVVRRGSRCGKVAGAGDGPGEGRTQRGVLYTGNHRFEHGTQGLQCAFAFDSAQYVLRDDVAGAFPDRAEVGVAYQPRVAPFFDVARAPAYFHRVAGHAPHVAAGAELDEWREDAHAFAGCLVAGIGLGQFRCGIEHHRARGLGGQHQLHQLAAHERQFNQGLAESAAMIGDIQRFGQRAAHHACGAHAVREPGHVDHVRHLHETPLRVAHHVGGGALQRDFAAGHRAGAEFFLEADDGVVVGRAVGQQPRQEEQRQALGAGRRAIGARKNEGHARIGIRAEPLVAVEQPVLSRGHRARQRGAHIRARALFGHEHRALRQYIHVLRGEARQVARGERRVCELGDRARGGVGHRQRAAHPEFGLHVDVGQRIFDRGRHLVGPAQHAAAMRHRRQTVLAERNLLEAAVARVLLDPLRHLAVAPAVVQDRRVLVGGEREIVERSARQCAQSFEVRQQVGEQLRLEVEREQAAIRRVGREEVGAVRVRQQWLLRGRGRMQVDRVGGHQSTLAPEARTILPHLA